MSAISGHELKISTAIIFLILLSRGAVEATRQAHHLIVTLIKDPECDINDHLPRTKPSLSSYLPLFTSSVTEATTHVSTYLTHVPISVPSFSQAVPMSREKRPRPASTIASSSHLPGNARWASPTYQAPPKVAHTVEAMPAAVTTTLSESLPIPACKIAKDHRSPVARQLLFAKATSPVTVPTVTTRVTTTTTSEPRNAKPLSYSKVAGGLMPGVPGSGAVEDQVEDGRNGTSLPPVISNILSQVGQTRSPIVWNDMYYAAARQNSNEGQEPKELGTTEVHEVSQPPLAVITPHVLFKPLPHEVSPPNVSGSLLVANSSPTLKASPSPPTALPSATEDIEKSSIRPIGTERAHRRTNTSPSPTLAGVAPLISTGKLVQHTF